MMRKLNAQLVKRHTTWRRGLLLFVVWISFCGFVFCYLQTLGLAIAQGVLALFSLLTLRGLPTPRDLTLESWACASLAFLGCALFSLWHLLQGARVAREVFSRYHSWKARRGAVSAYSE